MRVWQHTHSPIRMHHSTPILILCITVPHYFLASVYLFCCPPEMRENKYVIKLLCLDTAVPGVFMHAWKMHQSLGMISPGCATSATAAAHFFLVARRMLFDWKVFAFGTPLHAVDRRQRLWTRGRVYHAAAVLEGKVWVSGGFDSDTTLVCSFCLCCSHSCT
jgi:hypothetical protein